MTPITAAGNQRATRSRDAHELTCPCCGGQLPHFQPYGLRMRTNVMCPRCGSKKRHRLLWLFLRDQTNLFTDQLRVLHFAPERCFRKTLASLPNLEYVTADLHSRKAMLSLDITAMPLGGGAFDAILCSHVLEHVPDDLRATRELFRVLKPGGWAAVMVPVESGRAETLEDPRVVSPAERERIYGQHDHVRLYGEDFKDRLESAGFAVDVRWYAKELRPELVSQYGLKRKDAIYFCTKPV